MSTVGLSEPLPTDVAPMSLDRSDIHASKNDHLNFHSGSLSRTPAPPGPEEKGNQRVK